MKVRDACSQPLAWPGTKSKGNNKGVMKYTRDFPWHSAFRGALLSILDEKVLKAERKVKRALTALASAEKQEGEQERVAIRAVTKLENYNLEESGFNWLHIEVKRQKRLWRLGGVLECGDGRRGRPYREPVYPQGLANGFNGPGARDGPEHLRVLMQINK